METFFTLLDSGPFCTRDDAESKLALRQLFCLACDPSYSKYVESTGLNEWNVNLCPSYAEKVSFG